MTANSPEWVEVMICNYCTMLHANGEYPPDADDEQLAELQAVNRHFVVDCSDEACHVFATSRCDSCGNRLAGERHRAWLDLNA